jgi:hypothetical protein
MMARLSRNTAATLEAIVDQKVVAGDMKDAAFWREIAEAARVLQRTRF